MHIIAIHLKYNFLFFLDSNQPRKKRELCYDGFSWLIIAYVTHHYTAIAAFIDRINGMDTKKLINKHRDIAL
jgi:hypothetical protein